MNHRRREIVLQMAHSPICGKRSRDRFIERIYWRYAESRLRPADYTVNTHEFPYADYMHIK